MKITEVIFDVLTQTETTIEREQTAEEASVALELANQLAFEKIEAEAKATARQEVLAQLGITEEQAKLLLS